MKKRKLILLPVFMLLLAGCKGPVSSASVEDSTPPVTDVVDDSSEEAPDTSEEGPVAAIEFGADPFDGTAATGVAGVGVALYYDAKENGVAVAFDKVTFTVNTPDGVLFAPVIGLVEVKCLLSSCP